MKYLGIEPIKPRVAVFDFTSCEGCELQLANKEDTLGPFLSCIEIVNFREVTSEKRDDYDIALIEGSVSRPDEVPRLQKIRERAKVLVALGSCACYGGVHRMKNAYDLKEANKEVYGEMAKETAPVRALHEVVKVDLSIPGCPVSKAEVERIVQHVLLGIPYQPPLYPVCVECKQRFTVCMMDKGHLCLGSITRAGCDAPCPAGGLGCWGCRGAADQPNMKEFLAIAERNGFGKQEVSERLNFFGGFTEVSR